MSKTIKVTKDDKETEIVVKKPTSKDILDKQMIGAAVFNKALEAGVMTTSGLTKFLKSKNLWSDEEDERVKELQKLIAEGEEQFKRGARTKDGKKFTKAKARKLAIDMRVWRIEYIILLSRLGEYNDKTAEGMQQTAEFNFLVSRCCFYSNGKPVFEDYDDYISKMSEQYALQCASALTELLYEVPDDSELAENKFLVQHGFARKDDLRLVNEKGEPVDIEGKVIEEKEEEKEEEIVYAPFE